MILNLISAVEINIWKYIFVDSYSMLLEGLLNTLLIVIFAFPLGLLIGSIVGIAHFVPNNNVFIKIWKRINAIYVAIFRGTPIVVQLLFIYFGMLLPLGIPDVMVAILVFGLNSGAYVSEIVRGGIASVDKGQIEAGRSLGISYSKTMIKIILPQAVKNILPAIGNELIMMVKETSLCSTFFLPDVMTTTKALQTSLYMTVEPLIIAGLIYFVLTSLLSKCVGVLEKRLSVSD